MRHRFTLHHYYWSFVRGLFAINMRHIVMGLSLSHSHSHKRNIVCKRCSLSYGGNRANFPLLFKYKSCNKMHSCPLCVCDCVWTTLDFNYCIGLWLCIIWALLILTLSLVVICLSHSASAEKMCVFFLIVPSSVSFYLLRSFCLSISLSDSLVIFNLTLASIKTVQFRKINYYETI